jgi:hypothetical protein
MTREGVDHIVSVWIPRLGLSHWRIEVVWDGRYKDDPSFSSFEHAFTWRARDYDEARLYFNQDEMERWDLRRTEEIVVHELLHLVTREVEFVLDQIDGQLRSDAQEIVEISHRHAVEGAVERLACRIVEIAGTADDD